MDKGKNPDIGGCSPGTPGLLVCCASVGFALGLRNRLDPGTLGRDSCEEVGVSVSVGEESSWWWRRGSEAAWG